MFLLRGWADGLTTYANPAVSSGLDRIEETSDGHHGATLSNGQDSTGHAGDRSSCAVSGGALSSAGLRAVTPPPNYQQVARESYA